MKLKTISLLLSIVMIIGLISCDTKEADGTQGTSNNVAESSAEESSLSDVDDTSSNNVAVSSVEESSLSDVDDTSSSTDADSSEATDVSDTKTSEKTESNTETISETSTETVTETIAEEDNDFMEYVDFLVSVPEDRDPVILQLTDTQIIDPGQARTPLAASAEEYWAIEKRDQLCYDFIRETVEKTEPDLIIITGDLIYGAYDDNGSVLLDFIRFMESFDIPWAPVFGNHDSESKMGADWQCDQLEAAKNCLFLQRTLTGNGNYTVGIEQGGKLTRVFFMLCTNGCATSSEESFANGQTTGLVGFAEDQISWYKKVIKTIKRNYEDTKISFAFHIQPAVFAEAFAKYGTDGSDHIDLDRYDGTEEGDMGYIGACMKSPWDSNKQVWNDIKKLGVDSLFVGHEHANSASIVYEGVRLQYGMKSSMYDRLNFVDEYGNIVSKSGSYDIPLVGGSVIVLDSTGTIKDTYIYYCESAGGSIDWESFENQPKVNGLQLGSDLWGDEGVKAHAVKLDDGTSAYEVYTNGNKKLYMKAAKVKNKSTVTFTVLVPSTSTNKFPGYGEFSIRIKPNDIEPDFDGNVDGYITYSSSQSNEAYKIKFDEWQAFTLDISSCSDKITELSFVIGKENTIYIRDIIIE